jgi:hypothetical protein
VRAAAFRSRPLSLAKTCSIGLRSGEYLLEQEACSGGSDRLPHRFPLVRAEVVEDHDVAGFQRRDEELFDIGEEALAIDGAVEQAGRVDAVVAQGGEERCGLPMAVRDLVNEPLAARRPAVETRHIGLGPGLIDEDQARGIDAALIGPPARPMAAYVRTVLLACNERLFLSVTPIRRKNRLIIEVSALTPRSNHRRSQSS